MTSWRLPLLSLAILTAACQDAGTAPAPAPAREVHVPPTVSFAKPGVANPKLSFSFDPAGAITGDNAGGYANDACGVFAVINLATTDGLLDPDGNYSSRSGCGPRQIRLAVALPNGTITVNDGSYITIGGLGATTSASSGRVGFQLSSAAISATGCAYVRYGYPGDNNDGAAATITLTSGSAAKRSWEVTSSGGPICWRRAGKNDFDKLQLGPMPFKITITEL